LPHALPRNAELGADLCERQALPVARVHGPDTTCALTCPILPEGHWAGTTALGGAYFSRAVRGTTK
jgi:hypothetical protein